jgi:hypothetical protein
MERRKHTPCEQVSIAAGFGEDSDRRKILAAVSPEGEKESSATAKKVVEDEDKDDAVPWRICY